MQTNKAIVLVHPFDSGYYERQPEYVRARQEKLAEDLDIFILAFDVNETRRRISPMQRARVSIFKTCQENPRPYVGWEMFSSLLRKYNEVVFCGAELHLDSTGRLYTGCVLEAFRRTAVLNKRIDKSVCWIE